MSLQTGGADGPGRIVRLLVLVIPFALGQLVLQGGEHLSGPYLAHLHELALVDPDGAELRYIAVVLGVLTGTQLALGASAVLLGPNIRQLLPPLRNVVRQFASGIKVGIPLAAATYFVLWWVGSTVHTLTYQGVVGHAWGGYMYLALAVTTLGALCEELYFRGVFLREASKLMSPGFGVLLSTGLFGLWHPQAYGDPTYMILLLGMAWLFVKLACNHGSILPSTVCHAAVNIGALAMANS